MVALLGGLFDAVDVRYEQGQVDVIDLCQESRPRIVGPDGMRRSLQRRLSGAGSCRQPGVKPDVPGLAKDGFSVEQLEDATYSTDHLNASANRRPSAARDTVVVAVGGFQRHRGGDRNADAPGGHPGAKGECPSPHRRPQRSDRAGDGPANRCTLIEKALREAGVETETRRGGVTALNESGVTLSELQFDRERDRHPGGPHAA